MEEFWRVVHPRKADLIITRVVLEPARPKVSDLIGATIYYKNIGGKPARRFYLRLEPGPFDAGGFGLGGDYAHLEPGQEKPYSWGALRATKAGVFTLIFSINPEGSVDESNKKNNAHRVEVQVSAPEK
jgi:hypothetical protein